MNFAWCTAAEAKGAGATAEKMAAATISGARERRRIARMKLSLS